MKVIVAGHQKTGTKSMNRALAILGYRVYDFVENCYVLSEEWKKVFKTGGNAELFRKMYENVDAVCDAPSFSFWREIHNAFPESKIILSVRDNEDEWLASVKNQIKNNSQNIFVNLSYFFAPTFHMFMAPVVSQAVSLTYGFDISKTISGKKPNETLLKMSYRKHNADVLHNAPKNKLLVFNCKEGWDPLCEFLGVEVPNVPFPHENKKASYFSEKFQSDPHLIFMKRQAMVVASFLMAGISYGAYATLKYYNFV